MSDVKLAQQRLAQDVISCYSEPLWYCIIVRTEIFSCSAEFKQKEETTIRSRNKIQISIQEDPWNLPLRIKNLVDTIQKYVEGL